ncbi:hypothetical protein BaRGS_00039287 [Batillaria attramentaria]|uniref:Uncharacterized protein n=1 Tax=Batillaria attramentaria TaxID=370345 RepID=A0ABD0J3C4_9CAEN
MFIDTAFSRNRPATVLVLMRHLQPGSFIAVRNLITVLRASSKRPRAVFAVRVVNAVGTAGNYEKNRQIARRRCQSGNGSQE